MAASSTAARSAAAVARPLRRPAARPQPQPRRAPLRVVTPDTRMRVVGRIGTLVAVALFAMLLFVASLHAALVQTQARLDAQRAANARIVEEIATIEAELAWMESPAGVEEWAEASGLVRAPGFAVLSVVAAGELRPPGSEDPFAATPEVASG